MVAAKEKPKGTEQIDLVQGDGVAGAATWSDHGDLAMRCSSRRLSGACEGFFRQFPSSNIGIYFLHASFAGGAASIAAAQPRIAAAGRGAVVRDLRVANVVVRVRIHATLRKRYVILGITLGQL